jgi:hypothetical protein
MARIRPAMASQMIIVFFLLCSFSATFVSAEEEQGFGKSLDPKQHKLKKEKLSHFHFFFPRHPEWQESHRHANCAAAHQHVEDRVWFCSHHG